MMYFFVIITVLLLIMLLGEKGNMITGEKKLDKAFIASLIVTALVYVLK